MEKIKFHNMIYEVGGGNSAVYLGELEKEEIEYAKKNGIPIDTLTMQLKETINIFNE